MGVKISDVHFECSGNFFSIWIRFSIFFSEFRPHEMTFSWLSGIPRWKFFKKPQRKDVFSSRFRFRSIYRHENRNRLENHFFRWSFSQIFLPVNSFRSPQEKIISIIWKKIVNIRLFCFRCLMGSREDSRSRSESESDDSDRSSTESTNEQEEGERSPTPQKKSKKSKSHKKVFSDLIMRTPDTKFSSWTLPGGTLRTGP